MAFTPLIIARITDGPACADFFHLIQKKYFMCFALLEEHIRLFTWRSAFGITCSWADVVLSLPSSCSPQGWLSAQSRYHSSFFHIKGKPKWGKSVGQASAVYKSPYGVRVWKHKLKHISRMYLIHLRRQKKNRAIRVWGLHWFVSWLMISWSN